MRMKRKDLPVLHTMLLPWQPRCLIHGMGVLEITPEQRQAVGDICLGIFADMTNSGAPLQEVLAACYMSGVQHTLSTLRPNKLNSPAAEGGQVE